MPQTKWTVLTGGSCSGKTTLANYFQADGQEVIPEAANTYIETANSKDIPPQIAQSYGTGGPIPHLDLQMEAKREPNKPILLDRSLGDSLAFIDMFLDEEIPEDYIEIASNRYDTVFHLEQLDYEPHKTRTKDRETARKVHNHLEEFYREELDYEVINVPETDIEERAHIIAENSALEEPDLEMDFPKLNYEDVKNNF